MKGVEATPEEQERLATGNNNGSLDTKLPPEAQRALPRSAFYSTRVFMLVFLSGWVLQGMFLTYFVSVTTTLEKLYKVESKTTGTLLAATEIGQICTALFLTYLAGRGHRPRWIACMMLVLAVGVIGCVLPHLLYGTELLNVHMVGHTSGAAPVCNLYNNMTFCDRAQQINTETRSSITAVVIPWLFVCLLVVGVGQTGIATLGIPYVDDNVGSRQSPLYMGE
ncbi:solute carrier organic anion transporter family member 74D-like [Manduca sexta]|uniref:solute carrier organic anion transporter family member 74D-like n=1 Tax=Manduca sexta TaxID=7130 RepID=UPI00188FD5AC|nr:solute carrier organic anion transporter family member 74D-like [Manduca sexta]